MVLVLLGVLLGVLLYLRVYPYTTVIRITEQHFSQGQFGQILSLGRVDRLRCSEARLVLIIRKARETREFDRNHTQPPHENGSVFISRSQPTPAANLPQLLRPSPSAFLRCSGTHRPLSHAASHNAVPQLAAALTAMASDLSNGSQVASSVASTLAGAMSSVSADVAAAHEEATSWLGLFGWLLYLVFNLTSTLLYWSIRIVTISVPKLLYALFSTSWTVTMNATTLYVCPQTNESSSSWLTRCLACSSWSVPSLLSVGS